MNEKKKTVKVKKDNKEYELEVKDEEQTKDGEKFKEVKDGPFWKSAILVKKDGTTEKLKSGPALWFWISLGVGVMALLGLLYVLVFRKKKNKHEEETL